MSNSRSSVLPALGAVAWTVVGVMACAYFATQIVAPQEDSDGNIAIEIGDDEEVRADELTTDELIAEFAATAAREDFDLEEFRARLREERFRLNARAVETVAGPRLEWIERVERWLTYCCLAGLLLLVGPVRVYQRMGGSRGHWRDVLRSVPVYAVGAAVTMLFGMTLVDL